MQQAPPKVIVVGAGMVGLTLAIDLTLQGVPVVVLEKGTGDAAGSRSICQAKRTLEIWERLGVGAAIRDRGITWNTGRVFHKEEELFHFNLAPEPGYQMPAFVNLQQFHVEAALLQRFSGLGGEVRFGHTVTAAGPCADGVEATVEGPDGPYRTAAEWIVSCEGVRSNLRRHLGLAFEGTVFEDKFLICDVKMPAGERPPERWFWFQPPFHAGQTALLHRQADDVWRIDLQLGRDADVETERKPENVRPRIEAMLGHGRFEFVWISVYVFQCRTLANYVHGRVIFAGDSAHQVSPFGARGGNSGVQDADNLAWKLARVVRDEAPAALLESYDEERRFAARENILHSTRATDFMSPKSKASRILRDETLNLARTAPFARALINSGRLSVPARLTQSPLNTADTDEWAGAAAPGATAVDAPVMVQGRADWLLHLLGKRFAVLAMNGTTPLPKNLTVGSETVDVLALDRDFSDSEGLVAARYDLKPGSAILFRPDQHVAMRSRAFDAPLIAAAVRKALVLEGKG